MGRCTGGMNPSPTNDMNESRAARPLAAAEGSRPLPTKPTRKGAQPLGCGPHMYGPYILLYGSQKIASSPCFEEARAVVMSYSIPFQ